MYLCADDIDIIVCTQMEPQHQFQASQYSLAGVVPYS